MICIPRKNRKQQSGAHWFEPFWAKRYWLNWHPYGDLFSRQPIWISVHLLVSDLKNNLLKGLLSFFQSRQNYQWCQLHCPSSHDLEEIEIWVWPAAATEEATVNFIFLYAGIKDTPSPHLCTSGPPGMVKESAKQREQKNSLGKATVAVF